MADIIPPSPVEGVISDGGGMLQRFRDWTQAITRLLNVLNPASGTGSPEGVLAADAGKLYRNTAGPSLYWKSVDDVAGDATLGWLLVV